MVFNVFPDRPYQICRKTPCFSYGDIRHTLIFVSNCLFFRAKRGEISVWNFPGKGGDVVQLALSLRLYPDRDQAGLLKSVLKEYIAVVNDLTEYMNGQDSQVRLTSKSFQASLPSALKAQAIRDARSVFRKARKTGILPVLRKPVAIWNNQNWMLVDDTVRFPVWKDGKSHRIAVRFACPEGVEMDVLMGLVMGDQSAMRIVQKGNRWFAQIVVDIPCNVAIDSGESMGVDLGIKCPAVAVTSTGKCRFLGNGRQRKYVRRRYHERRKRLGKARKLNAIRKSKDKEQRWMRDQDHKLSREIVNFAVANDIGLIKLETLDGIRKRCTRPTRKSRKNKEDLQKAAWNLCLNSWSFYRLCSFIEYKAELAGISVEYIDPRYTSQTCPVCGRRNHAQDRRYRCSCGFKCHRDLVGAMNILVA